MPNLLTRLMGVAAVPADSRERWADDGLFDLRWCVGEWDEGQRLPLPDGLRGEENATRSRKGRCLPSRPDPTSRRRDLRRWWILIERLI